MTAACLPAFEPMNTNTPRLRMDSVSKALRRKAAAKLLMARTGERNFHKAVERVRRAERS